MAFQISPGIVTTEIDLTTVIPAVSTTIGAFVGEFTSGPANTIVTVDSENTLVSIFGKPNDNNYISFFTAASFLAYGNNLKIVRVAEIGQANASLNTATSNAAANGITIVNDDDWISRFRSNGGFATSNTTNFANSNTRLITASGGWAAKYPGTQGNTIRIAYFPAVNSANALEYGAFANWQWKGFFANTPGTSAYAASRGASNDEIHIVVIDGNGVLSQGGTPAGANAANAVLEVYSGLSVAGDAKNSDGSTNYYVDVLAQQSKYVRWMEHPNTSTNWGTFATNGVAYTTINILANTVGGNVLSTNGIYLAGGTNYSNTTSGVNASSYIMAWDKFKNADEVDVSLLITGNVHTSVAQHVIDNIAEYRKDCVAFISPSYSDVVNASGNETTNAITRKNTTINRSTSYAVFDSGWKLMFDKYNNVNRWIPLNGDIAGLCVRTDSTRDPWFSPAGLNRGQIKNVIKLSWNPNKTNRDDLYKAGVNPVVSFPSEGTILFGDKTMQTKPSAFDRINVRRLFITLEKAISTAAKYSLFEFNDEFTRQQFVSLVDPFLRDVQGRRGIYDYRVVCDETNNTPEVIDRNEFVGDIYIKPARAINFIQLNFVAVRTGVTFEEIAGRF